MAKDFNRRQFVLAAGGIAGAGLIGIKSLRALDSKNISGLVNGQPQGAQAGRILFTEGGNAVDAMVAAALAAGVAALPSTGIGGYGGAMVISRPDGKVTAIDFNMAAPSSARPDMFALDEKGNVKDRANTYGWRAAGVPGVLAGLQLALDRFGSKSLAEVSRPAITIARNGFGLTKAIATAAKTAAARFARDPGSAKLFLHGGIPPAERSIFKNPDLAVMLQTLADRGSVATFYKGDIADRITEAFQRNGGEVTKADLANYRALEVSPLALEWNGATVFTAPPGAGGLTYLEALSFLKALDWPANAAEPERTRYYLECLRAAWTDRFKYMGDPKQTDVPITRLLSTEYAKETAARVRRAVKAGKPIEASSDGRSATGTIHLNAIDSKGMSVALTFTHGNAFGAQVTVDGLGLVLGHGMSRFDPRPGLANSPGPGKRPLHNMCPTVVTRDSTPVLAIGATGGRRIVNALARTVASYVGERMPLAAAVAAPRIHCEGDLTIIADKTLPTADDLKSEGYKITTGGVANLTALERNGATGELTSVAR